MVTKTIPPSANALGRFGRTTGLTPRSLAIWVVIAVVILVFPLIDANDSHVGGAADAGVFILLALGLNIVVGYAGLLDLGYAAFFAIGAYTYAMTASPHFGLHLPFWPMLLAAAIIAAMFGALLGFPTLRLRGDYIAIVTLGFGEIVPTIILNLDKITGGPDGIAAIDHPGLPGFTFGVSARPYYYLILVIMAVLIWAITNLRDSRLGRAWMAVREDEIAAACMGINTTVVKLLAYALGASFSGFAGVLYVSKLGLASPDMFLFTVSVQILSMVVLGGMGSVTGVIAGAFILYELQTLVLTQMTIWSHSLGATLHLQLLQQWDFTNLKFLLYGVALVAMMLFRPEGLIPSTQRKAELKGEEASEPAPVPTQAA